MAKSSNDSPIPEGYVRLSGSERHPSKAACLVGPTDANETFKITFVLRRRPDGPKMPDYDYYAKTRPGERRRLTQEEFAGKYGAHPDEIARVVRFSQESGLTVVRTHLARRTVEVSGTAALFSKAFAVALGRYEHVICLPNGKNSVPTVENYRGRDGFIHVPGDLARILVGVFGLDNRTITKKNGNGDPPVTPGHTVAGFAKIYNFPSNMATGENIGILCPKNGFGGYLETDFQTNLVAVNPIVTPISTDGTDDGSFELTTTGETQQGGDELMFEPGSVPQGPQGLKLNSTIWAADSMGLDINGFLVTATSGSTVTMNTPAPQLVPVGTKVYFNPDGETTQDIWIAAQAAPGAGITVYFSAGGTNGWLAMVGNAVHPETGGTQCSVLSSSYYISDGDDKATLINEGVTLGLLPALSALFEDAALYEQTICVASGDTGSNSRVGANPAAFGLTFPPDKMAHVQYPGSDPNVLSVGGTTVGYTNDNPEVLEEFVWNDPDPGDPKQWGTTGGGVSAAFTKPTYQDNAGVPKSINDGVSVGRGVPDVAANASGNSSYARLVYCGVFIYGSGTSAAAPFWAGLIAVINANLKEQVGFINPTIYTIGSSAFNPIDPPPGPIDNSNSGIAGYPAGPGWDACTGWGSPNGGALLAAFRGVPSVYIAGGYQSPDIILTDHQTGEQVPWGGLPGGPWDTLLIPGRQYDLSAIIHNDSVTPASDVQVSFWAIPGGVGTGGTLLDTIQMVSVPAFSPATVLSTNPFFGPAPGEHMCAAVSIYSLGTGCGINAMYAQDIPDPGTLGAQRCSAWRNTDSMFGIIGSGFGFKMGLGEFPFHLAEPIKLRINPIHVPSKWLQSPRVREIASRHGTAGTEPRMPPYLLPALQRTLPAIELKSKVTTWGHGKMEPKGAGLWEFLPAAGDTGHSFEVTGEIPFTAKKGDIVLVKVVADYPRVEKRAARAVEFLQVIHIRAG